MNSKCFVLFPLLALLLVGCSRGTKPVTPSESSEEVSDRFSFDQIEYTLKSGVSRSEIKGAPWINSNLPDQLNKIEKPSLKDDFYAATNYDDIIAGKDGMLYDSVNAVDEIFKNQIINADSNVSNAKLFAKAKGLMKAGATSEVNSYLTSLTIDSIMKTKKLFASDYSYFSVEYNTEESAYYVDFNDGVSNGPTSITTLSIAGALMREYKVEVLNDLYTAFNLSISEDQLDVLSAFDYDTESASYAHYVKSGADYQQFTFGNTATNLLDDALLDYGLTTSSKIYVSGSAVDVIAAMAEYDSDAIVNGYIERMAFEYRYLMGIDAYRPLSKKLADTRILSDEDLSNSDDETAAFVMVKSAFSDAIEKSYLEVAGKSDTKQHVASIIEQIVDCYKKTADTYDWLDEKTKAGVLRKLNNMPYYSCYSDKAKNYTAIPSTGFEEWSLFTIYEHYQSWLDDLAKQGLLETDDIWSVMSSSTVNAFYQPTRNSFVILNGITTKLQNFNAIEEVLGSLGVIIGHEISHSIDSSGSMYDETGKRINWWSEQSKIRFEKKVEKMVNFYDQINLYDETYVDGNAVDGEATADMGGMHIALEIAKTIDNFNYDLFFKTYSNVWCCKVLNEAAIQKRLNDPHPYNYLRVNVTVAQFDEFYTTYGVKPGDRMYIAEDERVAIW